MLRACYGLAILLAAVLVMQWTLVAEVVAAVFERRATPTQLGGSLVAILAAWSARAAVLAIRERLSARASLRVQRQLRSDVVRQLLRLGPAATSGERAGELVTTATEGIAKLDGFVARFLPARAFAAVIPLAICAAVFTIDPLSGLVLLAVGPLLVVVLWLVGTRTARSASEQWAALGQLGAMLVDVVRVLPTLVAYGRAEAVVGWTDRLSETYRQRTLRVLRSAFLSGFVVEFGATLSTALVAVTVGIRLFEGDLALQPALLVLLLTPEFFAPLRALGADRHAAMEGEPAAQRVFAVLDLPVPLSGTAVVETGVPSVRVRDVSLRRGDAEVLCNVDLELPPLSRTALVGRSGAGKSSMIAVLLGFLAPDSGSVLVNGRPLTTVDLQAWRQRIAYVPERPWLLPGSVAENVRLGRVDADDGEVLDALRSAGAPEFVHRLPKGIDTPIGEDGSWLSGGERLRISLARAFVKNADLIVLDEPTSQLDEDTERDVLAALDELAVGRTLLTVTHRGAPLALHDRMVELVDGRLAAVQAVS